MRVTGAAAPDGEDGWGAAEERARVIIEHLPGGAAFVVGPDLRYRFAGGEALEAAGFAPADFLGKTVAEAVGPVLAAGYVSLFRAALERGEPFDYEHDAHGRSYISRGTPLRDASSGRAYAVLAVSYDITERKQAERRTEGIIERMGDAHCVLDRDFRIVSVNAATERVLGVPRSALIGRSHWDVFPASAAVDSPVGNAFRRVVAERVEQHLTHHYTGEGYDLHIEVDAYPTEEGGVAMFWRDVTERVRAEAALRASEEKYRALFSEMDEAYAVVEVMADDAAGRWTDFLFLEVNPAFMRHTGMPYPVGRTATQLLGTPNPRWAELYGRAAETGESVRVEESELTLGRVFDLNIFRLGGEGSRRVAVLFTDITKRKRAEEELRRSNDSLEARVGERTVELETRSAQLSAALTSLEASLSERQALVARLVTAQEEERRRISRELHDEMGQLLTGFSLGLKNLESVVAGHCPPDSGASDTLTRLRALAEGMGREVHRIAVELRPTALDDIGLAPALEAYVEEWRARTGAAAAFVVAGVDGRRLPPLTETVVYRVVQEALNNAAKYAVPAGATRVSVTLQRRDGLLLVTVEDDGPGFDADEVAARGRLGIAGMRERAELAGGTLEVETASGEGTTVYLRLPLPDTTGPAA